MHFKKNLLVFILLFYNSPGQAQSNAYKAYRILHSAPAEIISALNSPQSTPSQKQAASQSRLQKYFRIKSKVIRGSTIILELYPTTFIFDDYIPIKDFVRITIDQIHTSERSPHFKARFEISTTLFLNTSISLEPHISGSLMTITLIDHNINNNILKIFSLSLRQLGIIYDSPSSATASP